MKPPDDTDSPPAAAQRALQKGQQTRAAILDAALGLASHMGLEGLSIGALAEVTQMSKSGVFAHFGSREELQISVVREYHAQFSAEVDSGCIYISGAVEFDDRPGLVRDALVTMVQTWQQALGRAIRAAIAEGHLSADTDPEQVLFELHGLVLALHHDARFLRNPAAATHARAGFERLVAHSASSAAPAAPKLRTRPARKSRIASPSSSSA